MKKSLLFLAVLPFVFMACEKDEQKDDKQTNEPNELIISDTAYTMKEAFLNLPWRWRGRTYCYLYFPSDGVSYDTANRRNAMLGNGKMIQLGLSFRDSVTEMPEGSFADSSLDYVATYYINGRNWNDITTKWKSISLIDVGRTGSEYTIRFTLTDSSDRKTSVKYKGILKTCNLAI